MKNLGFKKAMYGMSIILACVLFIHVVQVVTAQPSTPQLDEPILIDLSYFEEEISKLATNADINAMEQKINTKVDDVEKSVLEFFSVLSELNNELSSKNEIINELKDEVEKLKSEGIGNGGASQQYEVIEMERGQKLLATESIELVLRGGTAEAIASSAGGLANLSAGTAGDILMGESLPLNSLVLIPRADGRGIEITSEKAWVMVKGQYLVD